MNRKITFYIITIFLLFAFSACGNTEQAVEPEMNTSSTSAALSSHNTPTPFPSNTDTITEEEKPPRASNTPKPSPSATPTATLPGLPAQTLIPWTAEAPFIPFPTFWYREMATTPIPTPDQPIRQYDFPSQSVEEYVELIRIADNYAHENDRLWFQETRPFFIDNQPSLNLLYQEALYYYSNTEYVDDFSWRLALTNVVSGSSRSDEWIVQKIEDELNTGLFSPQSLNEYLNQYGFKVYNQLELFNLFGDDQTNLVFIINSNFEWFVGYDGIVAVLCGTEPGEYELHLAASYWDFDGGEWMKDNYFCPEFTSDLNNNGIQEICILYDLGYSFYFPTKLYLLEWQGDKFVDLAKNTRWVTASSDHNGAVLIDKENHPDIDLIVARSQNQGEFYYYQFGDVYLELAHEEHQEIYSSINTFFDQKKYDDAISYLKNLTETGPPYLDTDYLGTDLGAELTDTLRFTLGLAYAYNGDFEQAKQVFHSLETEPTLEEYPIYAKIAAAFTDSLYDHFDLIGACTFTDDTIESAKESTPSDSEYTEIFGYPLKYNNPLQTYCHPRYTFEAAIESLPTDLPSQLPDFLRSANFEVLKSIPFDIFDDEQKDWMLYIQSPNNDSYHRIFAIQYQGHWEAFYLYGEPIENLPNEKASLAQLPGLSEPALIVQSIEDTYIYELIVMENQIDSASLESTYANFSLLRSDDIVIITSSYTDMAYDENTWEELDEEKEYWVSKVWNPDTKEFEDYHPVVFQNPEMVIQLAQINQDFNPSYELALAYQITGNLEKAKEIYWRTWAEDPGSMLALIAREKLSGVSP